MKRLAPRVLLAAPYGAVCIFTKRRCMDILDLVDSGISHGNACHACDRDPVCRV